MPTFTQALEAIRAETAVKREAHEAERARQARSGMGCDLGPFVGPSMTDELNAAFHRVSNHANPEAAMRRALLAHAQAGSAEAYAALAAADRGAPGWQAKAQAFLAAQAPAKAA